MPYFKFAFIDGKPFPCRGFRKHNWNGWACPILNRKDAEYYAERVMREDAEAGNFGWDDPCRVIESDLFKLPNGDPLWKLVGDGDDLTAEHNGTVTLTGLTTEAVSSDGKRTYDPNANARRIEAIRASLKIENEEAR